MKGDVSHCFSLKHLAHKNNFVAFFMKSDTIRDHAFAQHSRKFGGEIAHLIGVRKQNKIRFRRTDDLRQRE